MDNPLSDVLHFLREPAWTTGVYWLLLLGSIAIAVYAFATIANQRSAGHVGDWIFRFLIGSMWWQQTLWKLPPYYTDHPDHPTTTGLYYWMTAMGERSVDPASGRFCQHRRPAPLLYLRADRL
jgi:hypothetical protein